ncbi:threonine aspartase 1 isoform X5 [Bos taurus]|uniref:threonine aspartase 1 isoform X5 n=1 Tax=Bos taurus TaxID=9913 RepID=UPI000572D8BD|nr:threonine aspartase 1 isoform X5 [Bos taurus]
MTMEKGMSSGEGLPSRSSQVSAVKTTVKELETKQSHKEKRGGFVLVHAGAGYHSESKAKEYKHVCKRACQKAIEKLQAGALATDAVTAALVELEDSPFTNAGMGSNLNLLGEIECDASIMDGKSLNFGAVGALSGIKNPVSVANRLLCEGQKGKLSAGRIPPCFLVGEGAYRWAVDHGIPSCPPSIMTTRFSLAAFKRNKRKLELAERVETDFIQLKKRRQSSEKAALYGCGCWAENTGAHNPYSTAVSTSGCGEHLVRTILARECSHALQAEDAHQALLETMQNKFISSPFLASEDGVLGGVIVLRSCWCSAEPNSSQNKQTLLDAVSVKPHCHLMEFPGSHYPATPLDKYINYKSSRCCFKGGMAQEQALSSGISVEPHDREHVCWLHVRPGWEGQDSYFQTPSWRGGRTIRGD